MSQQTIQPKPKFKVGDKVIHKPDLYGKIEGEIIEATRVYAAVDLAGNFIKNGLRIMESDISSIKLLYEFDGETLIIHYPAGRLSATEFTKVYKFYSYNYVVTNSKMTSIFSQRALKLKNK